MLRFGSSFAAGAASCALLGVSIVFGHSQIWSGAIAQPAEGHAEKDAFNAAKELGTVEAWDAFLSNYPSGFHADLARAYVKKLSGAAAPVAAEASAKLEPAYELPCSDASTLKSERSDKPVKLRFVNESSGTVIIQWIDFNGALKEYGALKPGEQMTQETFITHPWIAAYQEGSCRQFFLPGDGLSLARLLPEDQLPRATPSASKSSVDEAPRQPQAKKPSKATIERRAKAACADIGMIYLNGKCAPKYKTQREFAKKKKSAPCPAGMYRNPYGQCQPNETGG